MEPQWQPVVLPDGLVDEGRSSASDANLYDDEQPRATVVVSDAVTTEFSTGEKPASSKRKWWMLLSKRQKRIVIMMVSVFLALVTLAVALLLFNKHYQNIAYVAWPYASVYPSAAVGMPNGTLQRGESVIILGKSGQFYQIRDMDGKTGYIERSHIIDKAPSYVRGAEFFGCRQYLSENSVEDCRQRAEKQFKACTAFCDTDISGQCQADCQAKVVSCKARCTK